MPKDQIRWKGNREFQVRKVAENNAKAKNHRRKPMAPALHSNINSANGTQT